MTRSSCRIVVIRSTLALLGALAAPSVFAVTATAAASQPTRSDPYAETIEVREVELRLDVSVLPPLGSLGRKSRGDFVVLEDGIPRELTALADGDASEWTFLLYFDPILAGPGARAAAAQALARLASLLVAGGHAEVVLADPLPRSQLQTASATRLADQLQQIANQAAGEASGLTAPAARDLPTLLRQLDRLTVEIAGRAGGGPRALLLPVDAWPVDGEDLNDLARLRAVGPSFDARLRPLGEAARTLAGYGWVTHCLSLRDERPSPEMRDRRVQLESGTGPGGDRRTTFPVFTFPGHRSRPSGAEQAQLDVVTDLTLTPLTELTRATSGALVGGITRLIENLERLTERRRIAYAAPPGAEPSDLIALEVRWRGGDGRALPALRWRRTTTPREVTAARLRTLLAGDPPPAAHAVETHLERAADSATRSRLRYCLPATAAGAWGRASIARQHGAETVFELGEPEELHAVDGRACRSIELPPAAAGDRLAIAVEDLHHETWAGRVLP